MTGLARRFSRRRVGSALLGLYGLALGWSHWHEAGEAPDDGGGTGPRSSRALVMSAEQFGGEPGTSVRLVYQDSEPDASAERRVVVLLHGSPGSSRDFRQLGPVLEADFRVIVPDLPGFGASTSDVPDYSIEAHAEYVAALMSELGGDGYHVVGFSMGGGVALHLVQRDRDRVRSVTLLSSIGVQELELFGDYHLNHVIHGVQLAGFWSLYNLVPHLGTLDGEDLAVGYARNFYDTDQRPLRQLLLDLEVPTLVVHGRTDTLVPVEAALEHHRLDPQSELALLDAGHFMTFLDGGEVGRPIAEFLDRVDSGSALTRAAAAPARLAAVGDPFIRADLPPLVGVAIGVFVLTVALSAVQFPGWTAAGVGVVVAIGRAPLGVSALPWLLGALLAVRRRSRTGLSSGRLSRRWLDTAYTVARQAGALGSVGLMVGWLAAWGGVSFEAWRLAAAGLVVLGLTAAVTTAIRVLRWWFG